MTNELLKPCPFCGSKAALGRLIILEAYFCHCTNDHCAFQPETKGTDAVTEEDAIKAWNARADQAPVDVEGLKIVATRHVDKDGFEWVDDTLSPKQDGWNACIDHLASKGHLRTPPINPDAAQRSNEAGEPAEPHDDAERVAGGDNSEALGRLPERSPCDIQVGNCKFIKGTSIKLVLEKIIKQDEYIKEIVQKAMEGLIEDE